MDYFSAVALKVYIDMQTKIGHEELLMTNMINPIKYCVEKARRLL